jgi:putative aldouronate transport system permease protein
MGEKLFEVINAAVMIFLMIIMLYPFIHVIFSSVSSPNQLSSHRGLLLKPLGFSLEAYKFMSKNPMIIRGYMNTIFIVVVGVTTNIVLTSLGAYLLSRKNLYFKNIIMFIHIKE